MSNHADNTRIAELKEAIHTLKCRIEERIEYWRNHDLRSGWTGAASGPCCEKCRMTSPKDPLQALVGCRDPFQINCECHIPSRLAVRQYVLEELESIVSIKFPPKT